MSNVAVGIDISKRFFDAAVKVKSKLRHRQFPNTPAGFASFNEWLRKYEVSGAHFCMEATSVYWEKLAYFLAGLGERVSVVNPTCVRRFAQSALKRTKTDKVDAIVIAEFTTALQPDIWTPPSAAVKQLQNLMRRMHALSKMRQQEKNRLAMEIDDVDIRSSVERILKGFDQEIARLKRKVESVIAKTEELRRQRDLLVSIPGIGDETAMVILSEVPAIQHFKNAKQLAAFAGLTPKEFRSGDMIRGRTKLSKTGSGRLRAALYMPTVSAKAANPILRKFYANLLANGKPPMVALCACMRKLLHIVFGVLKTGRPFCADFIAA